ncbi:MAG: hypothetical protein Q9166_000030 [cf. Caloplaca sp. 2 TL-2023]
MAPLTELSVNRPGKTRQVSLYGLSTSSGKMRPASLGVNSQQNSLPTASAIQSMLKNTTELGDIDSYVAKATKLPYQRSSTVGHPRDHQYHRPRGPYVDHAGGNHISQRRYYQFHHDQPEDSRFIRLCETFVLMVIPVHDGLDHHLPIRHDSSDLGIVPPHRPSVSSGAERGPFPTPLFYDYSEAFERESFHHTAARSSLFVARPIPQSDGSSEGYQTDVTNTSNTFAEHSSSSTEPKAITPERIDVKEKRPSPSTTISDVLKQDPPGHNKASPNTSLDSKISKDTLMTAPEGQAITATDFDGVNLSARQVSELSTSKGKMADPFTVPYSAHNELQYPPSSYNPAPKVIKTATLGMRLSSSSSGSQYSTSVHSEQGQTSNPVAIKVPSMTHERQPKALSVSLNRLEDARHDPNDTEPQQRAASLDTRVRPEILAPVPERSMSSRDSRDRFSRILSIGEDFGKRDLFTSVLANKKAPMTIQQYLRDKKSHSSNAVASTTKELPPLPDDSPPVPNKGKAKEIEEPFAVDNTGDHPTAANKVLNRDSDVFSANALEQLAALNGFARPGIPPRYSSISRNSIVDQPGPSQSIRDSILSQKPNTEPQPRMFALPKRNSSLFQIMKELPPLPTESLVSVAPPQTPSPLELPCRFTPLMPADWLNTAVADNEDRTKAKESVVAKEAIEQQTPTRPFIVGPGSQHGSTASPANARPWNLDTSYPWARTPPKLEVSIPQTANDAVPEVHDLPRFRLKVRRSSVLGNGGKLRKSRPPNIKVVPSPAASTEVTPVQTRFTESFGNVGPPAPSIALMPPSPGLQIEAQSFFSDDSSQKRRKGSLRRRLSQIRGMAMRTTSSDDIRGNAQGRSTSALYQSEASKRSSKQVFENFDDKSRRKSHKWKILDKVKSWYHRHEAKIKVWRSKIDPRNHRSHALSASL